MDFCFGSPVDQLFILLFRVPFSFSSNGIIKNTDNGQTMTETAVRPVVFFFLIKFFNSLFLFFSLLTLPTHDTTVRYLLPLLLLWLMASDVDSHIVNECERQRNLFRNRAEGTKKPDPSVLCSHPWGLHASFASRDRSLCSCDVHYVPNHVKAGHISYENPSTPPPPEPLGMPRPGRTTDGDGR